MELKRKLSKYINNHQHKVYFKILPLLCIFLILGLNSNGTPESVNDQSFTDKMTSILYDFQNSFNFSDTTHLVTTILIIITLWSGYKFWLLNYRIIRRNSKLTEQILFAASIVVFTDHINYNSALGEAVDYIVFLVLLYVILASSLLIAKIIDSFNLENDLYCWGTRILGIVLIFFGFVVLSSGSFALYFNPRASSNIFWISGVCIMLLGAFSEYRSFRRHGVFVYMR